MSNRFTKDQHRIFIQTLIKHKTDIHKIDEVCQFYYNRSYEDHLLWVCECAKTATIDGLAEECQELLTRLNEAYQDERWCMHDLMLLILYLLKISGNIQEKYAAILQDEIDAIYDTMDESLWKGLYTVDQILKKSTPQLTYALKNEIEYTVFQVAQIFMGEYK
jgi:hypothetical protein